jgi:hypothetical protein
MLLVSLGSDAENDVADLELVVAEEGGGSGADQGAGDLEEVGFGGNGDGLGEFARLDFLGGREGFLHGWISEREGGFLGETGFSHQVYKKCTNFRDAHTSTPDHPDFRARENSNG